jgi:hypothetical protein
MTGLLVLLVCLLTVYAPVELTRVIANWGLAAGAAFAIVFMWLSYGLALFILSVIVPSHVKAKHALADEVIK